MAGITTTEAARMLGVAAARVSRLLRDGVLKRHRGRNAGITLESVEAYAMNRNLRRGPTRGPRTDKETEDVQG